MSRLMVPIENFIYRILRINPLEEMNWKQYAGSLLAFNVLGILILMAILMSQKFMPLNPQGFNGMNFTLALNTA